MDVIDLTSQILVDGTKTAKSENQVCNGEKKLTTQKTQIQQKHECGNRRHMQPCG